MKLSRRHMLKFSAAGAGATLTSRSLARSEPAVQRDVQFDRAWKFLLGDPADASLPQFNDRGWRTIDLPHDWSFEDRPGAIKESTSWAPPVARWSPTKRLKTRGNFKL